MLRRQRMWNVLSRRFCLVYDVQVSGPYKSMLHWDAEYTSLINYKLRPYYEIFVISYSCTLSESCSHSASANIDIEWEMDRHYRPQVAEFFDYLQRCSFQYNGWLVREALREDYSLLYINGHGKKRTSVSKFAQYNLELIGSFGYKCWVIGMGINE